METSSAVGLCPDLGQCQARQPHSEGRTTPNEVSARYCRRKELIRVLPVIMAPHLVQRRAAYPMQAEALARAEACLMILLLYHPRLPIQLLRDRYCAHTSADLIRSGKMLTHLSMWPQEVPLLELRLMMLTGLDTSRCRLRLLETFQHGSNTLMPNRHVRTRR